MKASGKRITGGVVSVKQTVYCAVCSRCKTMGPASADAQEARENSGFKVLRKRKVSDVGFPSIVMDVMCMPCFGLQVQEEVAAMRPE